MAGCCANTYGAATLGHVECLQELIETIGWHPETTLAFTSGIAPIKNLELCISRGCPWHPETTWCAARNGLTDVLHLCVELGCPLHENTTSSAALWSRLATLRHIYEQMGDEVSWAQAGLRESNFYTPSVRLYIDEIKEDWKAEKNRTACSIKPANKNK